MTQIFFFLILSEFKYVFCSLLWVLLITWIERALDFVLISFVAIFQCICTLIYNSEISEIMNDKFYENGSWKQN